MDDPSCNQEDLLIVLHFGVEGDITTSVGSELERAGCDASLIGDMGVLDVGEWLATSLDIHCSVAMALVAGAGVAAVLAISDGDEDHGITGFVDGADDESVVGRAHVRDELFDSANNGTLVSDECGLQAAELDFDRAALIGDVVEEEGTFHVSSALALQAVHELGVARNTDTLAVSSTVEDDLAESVSFGEELVLTAAKNLVRETHFRTFRSPALRNIELNSTKGSHLLLLLSLLELHVVSVCGHLNLNDHFY